MKRFWYISMLLLMMLPLAAVAQKGLGIAPYFDGRYNNDRHVVTLSVKGKPLRPYRLTLYCSLAFDGHHADLAAIERAVVADGRYAVDKETKYEGGRLSYVFYCFPPARKSDKMLRFVFFRHSGQQTFLVYMEGSTTIDELKKMWLGYKKSNNLE